MKRDFLKKIGKELFFLLYLLYLIAGGIVVILIQIFWWIKDSTKRIGIWLWEYTLPKERRVKRRKRRTLLKRYRETIEKIKDLSLRKECADINLASSREEIVKFMMVNLSLKKMKLKEALIREESEGLIKKEKLDQIRDSSLVLVDYLRILKGIEQPPLNKEETFSNNPHFN